MQIASPLTSKSVPDWKSIYEGMRKIYIHFNTKLHLYNALCFSTITNEADIKA